LSSIRCLDPSRQPACLIFFVVSSGGDFHVDILPQHRQEQSLERTGDKTATECTSRPMGPRPCPNASSYRFCSLPACASIVVRGSQTISDFFSLSLSLFRGQRHGDRGGEERRRDQRDGDGGGDRARPSRQCHCHCRGVQLRRPACSTRSLCAQGRHGPTPTTEASSPVSTSTSAKDVNLTNFVESGRCGEGSPRHRRDHRAAGRRNNVGDCAGRDRYALCTLAS
jgi:hypothetical protein